MQVVVISDISEFAALAEPWDRLAHRAATPLVQHDWLLSAAEAFAPRNLALVVVRHGASDLRAAAPLVRAPHPLAGYGYRLLGADRLGEPCSLLYDGDEALRDLCQALVDLRHPLTLARLSHRAPVDAALREAAAGWGYLSRHRAGRSPFLAVNGAWADFQGAMSSRRRYDLRRARKTLEASGSVDTVVVTPSEADVDDVLARAFAIEASGWKGRAGSAIATNRAMEDFFRRFSRRAARKGTLRLSFLTVNDSAIAMQLGVDWGDRHWILKIGYDERWAHASPGVQLMHETVRRVFEEGLSGCEFLGVSEPWLKAWTRSAHSCRTYRFYPWSTAGAWAYVCDAAGRVHERLKRRR